MYVNTAHNINSTRLVYSGEPFLTCECTYMLYIMFVYSVPFVLHCITCINTQNIYTLKLAWFIVIYNPRDLTHCRAVIAWDDSSGPSVPCQHWTDHWITQCTHSSLTGPHHSLTLWWSLLTTKRQCLCINFGQFFFIVVSFVNKVSRSKRRRESSLTTDINVVALLIHCLLIYLQHEKEMYNTWFWLGQ